MCLLKKGDFILGEKVFELERRLADFPSLAKHIEKAENKAVLGDGGYDLVDTRTYLRASS